VGRLQQRSWTAEDGSARSTVEVVADELRASRSAWWRWAWASGSGGDGSVVRNGELSPARRR
jgi:single-stranded DNA-binding protein